MTPAGAGTADDIARKRALILDHESAFARALAARVIDRPTVTVWMILLPILLVHFLHRRQTFRTGCTAFAEHFLTPRRRALAIADGSGVGEGEPQDDRLRNAEAGQIAALEDHYRRLLAAEGDDYRVLVQAAYGTASAYREYLDRLEAAHDGIDAALLGAAGEGKGLQEAVTRIRAVQRDMYREETDWLFG